MDGTWKYHIRVVAMMQSSNYILVYPILLFLKWYLSWSYVGLVNEFLSRALPFVQRVSIVCVAIRLFGEVKVTIFYGTGAQMFNF